MEGRSCFCMPPSICWGLPELLEIDKCRQVPRPPLIAYQVIATMSPTPYHLTADRPLQPTQNFPEKAQSKCNPLLIACAPMTGLPTPCHGTSLPMPKSAKPGASAHTACHPAWLLPEATEHHSWPFEKAWPMVTMRCILLLLNQQLSVPWGATFRTLSQPSILDWATGFHVSDKDNDPQDAMDARVL